MSKTAMGTNNLDAFWMPFTANKQFKQNPRLLVSAKDMHYKSHDGREILDGTAGLWCCNAGHGRPKIVEAVQKQVAELDYAPAFQMGHPKAFELAARLAAMLPSPLDHVFFTNSGSESVDTALKIALAYHRAKGNGTKVKLIGRERGYHGVGFGGISVGGISGNRKTFGNALSGIDHIRHTHDLARNAYTRGEPEYGVEFADDLEKVIALHDASNIAAVIVEPVAGSTGVLIPPKGYLKRLREICTKHDILLIFDEVITGFGRLGAPFAVDYFGVVPDLVTTAKGITSGVIPMGAVFASSDIYQAFMNGPENLIELFHGYTYSGHPVACAAALATLDTYEEEGLLTRASELSDYWENALHALKGLPNVIDIRNLGLIGAIELQTHRRRPDKTGIPGFPQCIRKGRADPHDWRHHRLVSASDNQQRTDRSSVRYARRCVEELGIGAGKCR
ncbi:beta-alanine--pyruvate transaminase [Phyllobacterium ifriqiyense]|uniref:Beta-alanine--pyruvate transaminase n=1 Tax=Phyllobacterium ifriqiyense TaxID=314238 RepID=A0ABU0SA77_9HYPH|nr:beta-alanine--pyruvate transaminase [Phyllobacterium ifriqiyense]